MSESESATLSDVQLLREHCRQMDTFADAVARMRDAQRKYFADRSGANLRAAKDWERDVDKRLQQLAASGVRTPAVSAQRTLFESELPHRRLFDDD